MQRALRSTAVALVALAAACVPAPGSAPTTAAPTPAPTTAPTTTSPAGPGAPTILSFSAATTAGPAPLTTAVTWSISDPDGDAMTCQLDLDGDGTTETAISGCSSSSIRTASFSSPGTRSVRLDVSDGSTTTSAVTTVGVTAAGADAFGITIRFVGTMTVGQQAAFSNAVAKWTSLIKGGLYDVTGSFPADDCLAGMPAFSGTIDDLMIDAVVTPIDGAGGILGSAGPCRIRNTGRLPFYGVMKFDSADVAALEGAGLLQSTILHEMGHVLGLGTLWAAPLLTGAGTSNPVFNGLAAGGVWQSFGGTGPVPVENTGGSGTRDAHWRESTFDNELMTGWLDSGSNPLSRLTVAALGDLGYLVDLAGSDSYGLPGLLSSMRAFSIAGHDHQPPLDLASREQLVTPKGTN